MTKWADYLISEVKFNATETHIIEVKGFVDDGDSIGSPMKKPRQIVVDDLNNAVTFCTVYKKDGENVWAQGAMVKIDVVDRVKYITTHADGTKKDNLDNLPRYT